jgi:o-succinylbenzoate---CoA ligase
MPWLLENGKRYSFDEIKHRVAESSATRFCKEWLNGKTEFTLQTSGSTGTPKQIRVTRAQLEASANITVKYLQLKPDQTALVCLDISFVAGLMMLVRAMEASMNILVTPPEANPLQSIPETRIHFAAFVPYQVETILKSPQREKLNGITNVIIGGAPLADHVKLVLQNFTNKIYATYGMTETLTHIALQRLSGKLEESFQVLPGFSVKKDERDCLVIEATHLGNEPIITNDLVELLSNNQFKWLGRIDSVINSGGVKIIPEKVETVVATIFSNLNLPNRFFIAGLRHPQLGEAVTLVVEGMLTKDQTESLTNTFSQILSRYENPKAIYCLEKFIYTNSGKINRPETILLVGNN